MALSSVHVTRLRVHLPNEIVKACNVVSLLDMHWTWHVRTLTSVDKPTNLP